MVNIIMPTYNAHETIRQAIASVAMQDDLSNILLTIVDDCSDEPYDYLLDDFHYMNIEILKKTTNTGCGQSRQHGIDNCKCDYFMFLDADDCLYSPNAVKELHSYITEENLDYVYSDFLEELKSGDYLLHQNSGVWMHGKIYKTKYIREKNIRFNYTRANEDHAFNIIVNKAGGKGEYVEYTTYVWKYYPKSITRYGNYMIDSRDDFIINAEYTISELMRLDVNIDDICEIIRKYVISLYGYYNLFMHKKLSESFIMKYIHRIHCFYSNLPSECLRKISIKYLIKDFYENEVISKIIENGVLLEKPFGDYFNMLSDKR